MPIDTAFIPLLDAIQANKASPKAITVEMRRQGMADTFTHYGPKPSPEVSSRDLQIIGSEHIITARQYTTVQSKHPYLGVYFHGGGHMCGSVALYDALLTHICHYTQMPWLSIEYRLAPEYPYPHGLNDCIHAVQAIRAQPARYCENAQSMIIAGDSAGGNYTALICQQMRQPHPFPISKQLLLYPSLDFSMSSQSHELFAEGYLLERQAMDFLFQHYLGDSINRRSPSVSPLFTEDQTGIADTCIISAEFDPLRDEGKHYHDSLRASNVRSVYHEMPGMIHGFMNLASLVPTSFNATLSLIERFVAT